MSGTSDQQGGAIIIDSELEELRKKRLAFLKHKFGFISLIVSLLCFHREEENQRALKAGGGKLRDIQESEVSNCLSCC